MIFSDDAFYEPIDFGILKVVTIGHDNSGNFAGWYFDKVGAVQYRISVRNSS